jgi:predicted nucleotidyltransferase
VQQVDLNVLCEQVAISDRHLRWLLDAIERYIPAATVWAFGSRVTGSCRPTSDLDLAVHCGKETARNDLPRLNEALIESDLPFRVQLLDYDRLPESMKANIKEKYVVLYPMKEKHGES